MQRQGIAPLPPLEPRQGVLVVDGYGVRISVRRRHLFVSDGIGRYRRERAFPRTGSGLRRLVVLGHQGMFTLEALRWLHDAGIGLAHIERDGEVLVATGPVALNDASLRRAQALA